MATYHAHPWLTWACYVGPTAISFGVEADWCDRETRVLISYTVQLSITERDTATRRFMIWVPEGLPLQHFAPAQIRKSIDPTTAYICIHKSYCSRIFLPTWLLQLLMVSLNKELIWQNRLSNRPISSKPF